MLGPLVKVCLFLSSYIPLFAILTVRYWDVQPMVSYASIGLSILGGLGLLALWAWIRGTDGTSLRASSVQRQDQEVLAYLVTYLFPFLELQLTDPRGIAVALLLFVTVGLLYVSSSMLHVNPTLAMFGVHVFEVESQNGKSHTVVTRANRLIPGEEITVISLSNRLHWGS